MPEISHTQLDAHLKEAMLPASVYLIYGEEYFYKNVFDTLVTAIIPDDRKAFNFETLDGTEDNIFEAIERVNTFSLDTSAKVIGFCDADIFYSKQDNSKLIKKIKTSLAGGDTSKAVNNFQKLLALMDIEINNIGAADRSSILKADQESSENDTAWLENVIDACGTAAMRPTAAPDALESLRKAIEKGFAPANHLIITTDLVDKRRKLFKSIKEHGVIIDCSVATGNSQADRKAQTAALVKIKQTFEATRGKKLATDAFQALQEMTGFEPRTVANSLEKLGDYVGERETITKADVKSVLKRTKTDPIYELTNAVADRNVGQALFYTQSLLNSSDPIHPLQVIAALSNQTRALLVIKSFMNSRYGTSWNSGIRFDIFKNKVAPDIERYDAEIHKQIEKRDEILKDNTTDKKKKKKGPSTSMVIAANPRNLYPIYKKFEKAANFSEDELLLALNLLRVADLQLKTTAKDHRLVLDHLIITICRGSHGMPPAQKATVGESINK